MVQKSVGPEASGLGELRRRFQTWRKTGRKGRRIPDELWSAAVDQARDHGIHRVARCLGVEYNGLKRRVNTRESQVGESLPRAGGASFIELGVESLVGMPACVMELASRGKKLTIQLTGYKANDVVALAETLAGVSE